LYADLSTKLSAQPLVRWVAPEWWGLWPAAKQTGYFREHPAGLFWIPAALGRVGVPPVQASYIFGIAAGLASLLLAGWLVMRVTSREDGRAALVLMQLMPLAFTFRIRDNHEYPMLVCLVASLAGLDGVSRSWRWIALVMIGLSAGLLVKGVFVSLVRACNRLWRSRLDWSR
jgi:4-amino-4-deoxy-L-arabinose transferase-like glycosyltransferase